MKQILTVIMTFALSFFMSTCTLSPETPAPDYLSLMADAAVRADMETGRQAEYEYRAHLAELGAEDAAIAFDDLFLLAKFIYSQSGRFPISEDFKMCVGEVVLNRVESREFPDTIAEVIYQEGQFEGVHSEDFQCHTVPPRDCVDIAVRLLQGERLLAPHVVHFSAEPETEVYATFCDRQQNFTYFYESEHPRFYHLPNKKST